jgi:aromatic-L-amino-acid/L-tryptophan decarboxylase
MRRKDYGTWAARAVAWSHDYLRTLRRRPVRAQLAPGEIAAAIPARAPEQPEPMDAIWSDFESLIPRGMTHWQHPRFFAYFPANAAPASMVAEILTATMAAQCMLWQTSPAATELEARMVDWLGQAFGLEGFTGVIQDTATSATLAAMLTMRERVLDWQGNAAGLAGQPTLRVYASAECHSSVEKAARIAGIGEANLVRVPTDADDAMRPDALRAAIRADRAAGMLPAGLVVCVGGTSVGASDPVADCIAVARDEGLFAHVDAAWAGSAMICPELRSLWAGVEGADSVVINAHKWLGAQFDCSLQFLKDPAAQVRTLATRPDYLATTGKGEITDYSEWSVPLGRRFRALKLWFLLRAYGLEDLRARIRDHVAWSRALHDRIAALPDFRIVTPPRLSLFTFQWAPEGRDPDKATAELLERINDDGRIYLTRTRHRGRTVIRFQVGQFDCTEADVGAAFEAIRDCAGLHPAER